MSNIRVFGALLIFCSCGFAGILMSQTYLARSRNLKGFVLALQLLETEINYLRTTLPEALLRVAAQTKLPVAKFFSDVADQLNQNQGISAQEAWQISLTILKENAFAKEDIEAIASFGAALGVSDSEDQLKHITLLRKYLENSIQVADEEKNRNVRLWLYLGFTIGAMV
ncbi:MAG: hypothetical protein GX020_09855, partial [Firmicutes bacterium]|nr:hypothetical protein [Bacillota bacterium]